MKQDGNLRRLYRLHTPAATCGSTGFCPLFYNPDMPFISNLMLRRFIACALLAILPLQALAAVVGTVCALPGDCPMAAQMQAHDMHESGCEHHHASPAQKHSKLPCNMDHCPLLAAPAVLPQTSAVYVQAGRSPQQTLVSSDFQSADTPGLLRPPRLSI